MTTWMAARPAPGTAPPIHQAWKASLPPEYTAVEQYVTQGGTCPPATELLCPLLLTSGLPRPTLAQLWELANRGRPGHLTISELHCLLAMVALAQRGQPLKVLEDGSYPVPHLNLAQFSIVIPQSGNSAATGDDFDDFKSAVKEEADEFCDFQQALPSPMASSVYSSATHASQVPNHTPNTLPTPHHSSTSKSLLSNSASFAQASLKTSSLSIPVNVQPHDPPTSNENLVRHNLKVAPSRDLNVFCTPTENVVSWPHIIDPKPLSAASSLPSLTSTSFLNFSESKSHFNPPSNKQQPPPHSSIFPNPTKGPAKETARMPPRTIIPHGGVIKNPIESSSTSKDKSLHSASSILQPVSANEDKYSCFRNLDIVSDVSCWSISDNKDEDDDDDFGDFVVAAPTAAVGEPTQVKDCPSKLAPQTDDDNDDYLPFVSSPMHQVKAGESLFLHPQQPLQLQPIKPQDLLATVQQQECQSVSSLELDLPAMPAEEELTLQEVTLESKLAYTRDILSFQGFDSPVRSDSSSIPSPAAESGCTPASNATATNTSTTIFDLSHNSFPEAPIPPERPSPSEVAGKVPADRYSCIRQEVEQKQQGQEGPHVYEWTRCLRCCLRLIAEAGDVLGMVPNPEVCREVLTSEQGSRYLTDLGEVYRVAERVAKASSAKNNPKIEELSRSIKKVWEELRMLAQDLDIKVRVCEPEDCGTDVAMLCGVCLLQVKDGLLWFGGRKYHAGCANLWVNCVEPILPSLRPFNT